MNKQEIFDTVVTHLFTHGKQATENHGEGCVYRTEGGLKCAAGCLITDEFYSKNFEGLNVYDNNVHHAICKSLGLTVNDEPDAFHVIGYLQDIHDSADVDNDGNFNLPSLFQRLLDLAGKLRLNTDVLNKFKPTEL